MFELLLMEHQHIKYQIQPLFAPLLTLKWQEIMLPDRVFPMLEFKITMEQINIEELAQQ